MLEELGEPYELVFVDLMKGEQHGEPHKGRNPMGKVPVLQDGDVLVAESAAIGVYLADKYAAGRLSPALDAPERAAFLRWCFYAPSVIEPGCMARAANWAFKLGQAGWGTYENMLDTIAIGMKLGMFSWGMLALYPVVFSAWLTPLLDRVEARFGRPAA